MKITNVRSIFTANSVIGKLSIDGVFKCYVLEPFDRGLDSSMSLEEIKAKKILAHTAIPVGEYKLKLISGAPIKARFGKWLEEMYPGDTFMVPELQDVKGFEGVLIHPGNFPKDTEGCSLVGQSIAGPDFIGGTPLAFETLQKLTFAEIEKGDVTYEIARDKGAWDAFQAHFSQSVH